MKQKNTAADIPRYLIMLWNFKLILTLFIMQTNNSPAVRVQNTNEVKKHLGVTGFTIRKGAVTASDDKTHNTSRINLYLSTSR